MSAHSTGRSVERTICCILMRDAQVREIMSETLSAVFEALGVRYTVDDIDEFTRNIQLDLLENDVEGDCA